MMEDCESGTGWAVVCRWNEKQHGRCPDTSKDIEQHWFVLDVLDNEDLTDPQSFVDFYASHSATPVSLEYVDYYCLPGQEMVGICKTFWLKMIQRKWRKVFAERKHILHERMRTNEIIYRQRHGRWSDRLEHLPSLNGMLAT